MHNSPLFREELILPAEFTTRLRNRRLGQGLRRRPCRRPRPRRTLQPRLLQNTQHTSQEQRHNNNTTMPKAASRRPATAAEDRPPMDTAHEEEERPVAPLQSLLTSKSHSPEKFSSITSFKPHSDRETKNKRRTGRWVFSTNKWCQKVK